MLYKLETDEIESSTRIKVGAPADFRLKERDIENFLKSRLSEIVSEDQLMLIGQEWKGKSEADLLALDKDGTLYIFELKRWEAKAGNLLQVMGYGQKFGRYTYEQLERFARSRIKLEDCLKVTHKEYFNLDKELSDSDFNKDQVFVLVTNGTDEDTISAVNFWSQKGLRIECSPYRIYDIDGVPYIQFDTYNPDKEVLLEVNTDWFIVNTNKTYDSNTYKDMLGDFLKGKASAYYDRKFSVCRISRGSQVYLYHTGVGVIAKGVSTAEYQKAAYDDVEDEEFFVPLKFDWALKDEGDWEKKTPTAGEINSRLDSGHKFRQTVFSITPEMANAIDSIYNEHNKELQ